MAKWGEGDPRWIVEERADATNVNNWHWTEKNATGWSKDKLTSLLSGLVIEDSNIFCEITELTKIEGEASANNRKSKLFFFYEWEIKATWKGRLKAGEKSCKGEIEIPNLSEEHNPTDVDVNITLKDEHSGGDEAYILKEFLRSIGVQQIRERLAIYIKDLKQEFSQGMILPKKETSSADLASLPTALDNGLKTNAKQAALNQPVVSKSTDFGIGVQIKCKSLKEEEDFKCSVADLYRVLTDRDMIRAFTTGDAQVDTTRGGRFALFGGNVCGEFTDLVQDKRIVMRWRFKTWPPEHYSTVTLDLTQKDDCTNLSLSQTGIPIAEFDKTKEGWKNHYWQRIKQTFGFGANLY